MAGVTHETILPGNWVGVFGGGQLGRMFTHAAQRLGYHVIVFDPEEDCPAAQCADVHMMPSSDAEAKVLAEEMARLCSVITLEFENIDVSLLRLASRVTRVAPGADFLEMCQERILEKTRLSRSGFPVTPFRAVESAEDIVAAGEELEWPLVVKTARSGYDGKGQVVVRNSEAAQAAWKSLATKKAIAEKMIAFDAEVSVIAARNASGQIETYPLLENEHANHILNVTRCPVSSPLRDVEKQAREIAVGIAEAFGVIGLFCTEFFVTGDGELMINEIAPRPHNSGHLTMDAFACSQFEQQVRAICNLPLQKCEPRQPAAMINILGDLWEDGEPNWQAALSASRAHLHLYGKHEARPGRKMGHLNVLDDTSSEAAITAKDLHEAMAPKPSADE